MKNFHTHTSRCMHANGKDEEYVLAAIEAGYEVLGFSDHTPWKYDSDFVANMRMPLSQFDDYYQSISSLKEKYKDKIEIKIGLECEYYPKYMDWLKSLAKEYKLDYLIFGNHYYQSDETGIYYGNCSMDHVEDYFTSTLEGLQTGMYSCLAHPELILLNPYLKWNDRLEEGFHKICKLSKELEIPLEYNVLGFKKARQMGFVAYPNPRFWQIASQYKNKAIIGMDAHQPFGLERELFLQACEDLSKYNVEIVDTLKKVDFASI